MSHKRTFMSVGGVVLLALTFVVVALLALDVPASRAAPLAIERPGLEVTADPPGGTSSFGAEPFTPPGEDATFTLVLENSLNFSGDGVTATAGFVRASVYPSATVLALPGSTQAVVGDRRVITWSLTSPLTPGHSVTLTLNANLPTTEGYLLGESPELALDFLFDATLEDDDADVQNARQQKAYYEVGPFIESGVETSIDIASNSLVTQVVAGEELTTTVTFSVAEGTIAYTATPYIVLQEGLSLTEIVSADTPWVTTTTDLNSKLKDSKIRAGTQVEFEPFDAYTGTSDVAKTYVVRAVVLQGALVHESILRSNSSLMWYDADGTSSYVGTQLVSLNFLRPEFQPNISYTYVDSPGVGEAGGKVRFTIANTDTVGHPPAYDLVLGAVLGEGLTYDTSSPSATPNVVGGMTYLSWNKADLGVGVEGEFWPVVVTATLPGQLDVGKEYTVTAALKQDTYQGVQDYEGVYTETGSLGIVPGMTEGGLVKTVSPNEATIGDVVTYTIVFTQGAGSVLETPRFEDTLPLGFEYIEGSLTVNEGSGAYTVTPQAFTSADKRAGIKWTLETITATNQTVIESTFQARLTGENTEGDKVYFDDDLHTELDGNYNYVQLYAMVDGAEQLLKELGEADEAADVTVVQPQVEVTSIKVTEPVANLEIERGSVYLELVVQNKGKSPAYDVEVCDDLPQGLYYFDERDGSDGKLVSDGGKATAQPERNQEDLICWTFSTLAPLAKLTIEYEVIPGVRTLAGVPLHHVAEVQAYSSQLGDIDGERVYKLAEMLPLYSKTQYDCDEVSGAANCPYVVLGMEVVKTGEPAAFRPGEFLTYTIAYTNTSRFVDYSQLVVSDTYDELNLDLVSVVPAPTLTQTTGLSHTLLVWDWLTPSGALQDIVMVMQVKSPLEGVESVTNMYEWYSDASQQLAQQPPLSQTLTTPLAAPKLSIAFTNPMTTQAASNIIYTVVYSNDGTADGDVLLLFDYDDELVFVGKESGDATGNTDGTVFTDTLEIGEVKTLEVELNVNDSLPYDKADLTSRVVITCTSDVVPTKTDSLTSPLIRPVFNLMKQPYGNDAAVLGSSLTYDFVLENTGTLTANNCVITDVWGSDLDFTAGTNWGEVEVGGATVAATYTTGLDVLGLGDAPTIDRLIILVDAGSTQSYFTNTVAIRCDEVYGQVYTRTTWVESFETSKKADDVIGFPGRTLRYTVYYTNTSFNIVENAVVTDTLPEYLTYEGCSGAPAQATTDWTCEYDSVNHAVVWEAGIVQSDYATGQFEVWGTVSDTAADEGKDLVNKTSSVAKSMPERPGNIILETPIIRPRLALTMTLWKPDYYSNVAPGDLITYELAYVNWGTATADNVVVRVTLPDTVLHVSGGSFDEGTGQVTWNLDALAAGAEGTLDLVLQVKDTATGEVTFGSVDDTGDGNISIYSERIKDTDVDRETVYGPPSAVTITPAELTLYKSSDPADPANGDPLTYTIAYSNTGGGVLHNIIITDQLSTQLVVIEASGNCVHSNNFAPGSFGGIITCTIGTLDQVNSQGSVWIKGSVANAEGLTNVAWGYSDETGWKPSNSVGDTAPYGLGITIVSATPHNAGDPMEFRGSVAGGKLPINLAWGFPGGTPATGANSIPAGTTSGVISSTYDYAGSYTVYMTATNDLGSDSTSTTFSVLGEPDIVLNATDVAALGNITAQANESFEMTLRVSNATTATDDLVVSGFAANPAMGWLTPTLGTPDPVYKGEAISLTVSFKAPNRAGGYVTATKVTVTSNDPDEGSVVVPVTLTIGTPDIAVTPDPLSAQTFVDQQVTKTLTIQNPGSGTLRWSLAFTPTWLAVSVTGEQETAPGASTPVSVTFDASGLTADVYPAMLEVTNNATDTFNVPVVFTVTSGCTPISGLSFTYVPGAPRIGQTVQFSATVTGGDEPIEYTWDFGGDGTGTGQSPTHTFNAEASYTVTVTATNACTDPGVVRTQVVDVIADSFKVYVPLVLRMQ